MHLLSDRFEVEFLDTGGRLLVGEVIAFDTEGLFALVHFFTGTKALEWVKIQDLCPRNPDHPYCGFRK